MILQALKEYYDRKAKDPESGIAPDGFEYKEIPFLIILDLEGNYIQIEDTRQQFGKQLRAKSFLVHQSVKRSGNNKPNLLWDNLEYALGICAKNPKEKVDAWHESFIEKIKNLNSQDAGIVALLKFLSKIDRENVQKSEFFEEIKTANSFLAFRLNGNQELILDGNQLVKNNADNQSADDKSICLISGCLEKIADIHPSIKGVRGANTTGGNLVSFNEDAFCSYNKVQGRNSPIGEKSAFFYTTALNHLLSKVSQQKTSIPDATIVFWSEKPSELENDFSCFFDEPSKDNPNQFTDAVKALYKSIDSGFLPVLNNEQLFYILGLSPNGARISIRFWHVDTVDKISKNLVQYFSDLNIIHPDFISEHFPLRRLLKAVAPLSDLARIPPNMAGDLFRSVLCNLPIPYSIFQMAVRKTRAHRDEKIKKTTYLADVEFPSVGLIKAYLNRKYINSYEKEIQVALDKENTNIGYRIGRLFATLEKIQEEANPSINSTIRDRYYSATSGTPSSVLPILMRLKNHHLAKLEKPRLVYFERILGEIISELVDFPHQLNLHDQGRFAIGYYHQRQDFFTKS